MAKTVSLNEVLKEKLRDPEFQQAYQELDEAQHFLHLAIPDLGIDVCGFTREELDQALEEEIDVLWRNYALAPDYKLTTTARALKLNLLATLEEVKDTKK